MCGRYEGVDERFVASHVDLELSLGDMILTGGEPAALCVIDAVVRLLPGVLGNQASAIHESFTQPLLEHPHFTRPPEYNGLRVPEVLTSGHHANVGAWRHELSVERTRRRRPDLLVTADAHTERAPEYDDWLVAPRHDLPHAPADDETP